MSLANILIIEDETILSLHIEKVLKKLKVNIVGVARNSKDALALSEKNKIDIIISDINIDGDLDGIETSKIIQYQHGSQIIFLTGFQDEETTTRASEVEFIGYLLKPFREDQLIVLINIIIQKYHFNNDDKLIKINEYHDYNKSKGLLYLNEKELYLSRVENTLFRTLFASINMPVPYGDFDFEESRRKTITSSLNTKLKGLVVRDLKEDDSLLLTFK
ncbi:response regulator [Poseidonibacter lekithochrous]|uniref:response regulator n=1 Tax=Poseidonibacter lekithochrous TaxID=1904463 RepID=UPI0013DC9AA7|nr:response regulator [Poseidonibacter lekithochrous]